MPKESAQGTFSICATCYWRRADSMSSGTSICVQVIISALFFYLIARSLFLTSFPTSVVPRAQASGRQVKENMWQARKRSMAACSSFICSMQLFFYVAFALFWWLLDRMLQTTIRHSCIGCMHWTLRACIWVCRHIEQTLSILFKYCVIVSYIWLLAIHGMWVMYLDRSEVPLGSGTVTFTLLSRIWVLNLMYLSPRGYMPCL